MSITDELRKWWVRKFPVMDRELHKDFTAIADRIDAEHEAACAEAYGNGVMSVPIALDERAWIKLPVDADGVPISIGDVMVYADGNTCPTKVVALVPPSVFLTDDGPRYADMCRHKPTTVEDVLRDMHMKLNEVTALYVNEVIDSDERDRDEARIFAEYAAKLQLREVDE